MGGTIFLFVDFFMQSMYNIKSKQWKYYMSFEIAGGILLSMA